VHAYVNTGFLIEYENMQRRIVQSARICFGNISPDFVHAEKLENLLSGKDLYDPTTVAQIFQQLPTIIQPEERPPEASPEYRRVLACSLLYKFLLATAPKERVQERYRTGGLLLERPLSSGSQSFETIKKNYPVTQPVQKLEGEPDKVIRITWYHLFLFPIYCIFKVPYNVLERPLI